MRDSGHEYRSTRPKNGQEGIGPQLPHYRRVLLEELLTLQEETKLELIGPDEINAIHLIWAAEGLDVLTNVDADEGSALYVGQL